MALIMDKKNMTIKDLFIFNTITNYVMIEFASKFLNVEEDYFFLLLTAMGNEKLSNLSEEQKNEILLNFKQQYPQINWELLENEEANF
jgi:hypothetical protein